MAKNVPPLLDFVEIRGVVAEQLRAARLLRKYSLRGGAMRMGISASYLSQLENGQRNISLDMLFRASRTYKVSVDVLLGRERLAGNSLGKKVFSLISDFFWRPVESGN